MFQLSDKINGTSFTWARALWHPKWSCHIFPNSEQVKNIEIVAKKLQFVKDFYKKEIFVTSWLRNEAYNSIIGGKPNSHHIRGMAVDFYVDMVSCQQVQKDFEPKLEELNIRMERGTKSWVHIDIGPVVNSRYFWP